jgi:hypothetical protein
MVEFEFKWTNQEATPHYCTPAPVASGSAASIAWPGFNTGATLRARQVKTLTPTLSSTLIRASSNIRIADASASGASAIDPHGTSLKEKVHRIPVMNEQQQVIGKSF